MHRLLRLLISFVLVVSLWGVCSAASETAAIPGTMNSDVLRIAEEWARIKYRVTDKDEQLKQIDRLSAAAAGVARRYPGRVEPLLWQGIVASEEAAMAHVFDKLGYAKAARQLFEQAESVDGDKSNAGIPLSLGVLYYKVPGFPLGFGSDTKARGYLEKAMAMDRDGLDTAYFYGDFLVKQGEYAKAREVLVHGLAAPVNPNRPIWDEGRRTEVKALLARIDKEGHR